MYEQMKPGEAATIFNDLDMQVLVKVAGGMNPRKMAPILAKMTSVRAQALTLALAAIEPEPTVAVVTPPVGPQDLSALPQIVGQ
jgi:flagellar motility protein MotE (MotC chaperone)